MTIYLLATEDLKTISVVFICAANALWISLSYIYYRIRQDDLMDLKQMSV